MACPTCDHTMIELGCRTTGNPFFTCPRCGTVKTCDGNVSRPALVDCCREFFQNLTENPDSVFAAAADELWKKSGIRESINLPAARP